MPNYVCKVVNASGAIEVMTFSADSRAALIPILEEKKLDLISATEEKTAMDVGKLLKRFEKVSVKDINLFTNQLKTMFKAGIPLVRSLEILEQQVSANVFKKVIHDLRARVNAGETLSAAMSRHPKIFSDLYVNMIRAGESAGAVDQILAQLQKFTDIDIKTKKSIKKATRYPLIVLIVLMVAGGFATTTIIPKFANMILARGQELPLITKALMGVSAVIKSYGLLLAIFIAAAIFGIRYYLKTENGAYQVDSFKLKLPIMKNVVMVLSMSRFSMILNTLVKSGVPITDAMKIAMNTIGNKVYTRIFETARQKIIEGQPIHKALKQQYVPDVIVNMIAIGEETGALEEMLNSVGMFYEAELEEKLEGLTSAIEPVTTLLIGIFVAGFVSAIFLPLFQMYSF